MSLFLIMFMRDLEGLVPVCCWALQANAKLKRGVELNDFNKNCYDNCHGYNPQCPTYRPMDSGHSKVNLTVGIVDS
jgi:hypothetical protein